MKRILVLIFSLVLLLMNSGNTMAALSAFGDATCTTDTWFFIEDKAPYVEGAFLSGNNSSEIDLEYFKDDQTFASLASFTSGTTIQGNYLFDSGFFIGLQSWSLNNQSAIVIAPGYRYNFDKKNYAAFSFDYTSGNNTNDITNIEISGKYFAPNLKSSGSLSFPRNQNAALNGRVDYKVSKDLTVGGELGSSNGNNSFFFGGTYNMKVNNNKNKLILDGALGNAANSTYIQLSGMYNLADKFNVGGEFSSSSSQITLKANYMLDKVKVVFKYALQSGNNPSILTLAGKMLL